MIRLTRDGWLLIASKFARNLGFGFSSIILGLHLAELGLEPAVVGTILSAALIGSALLTAFVTARADRLGRRRTLIAGSSLMVASGLAFAFSRDPWVLGLAALTGALSPTSGEVGPFETVESAILPQTTTEEERNRAFGLYNSAGAVAVAIGALLAALPTWLGSLELATAYRSMFAVYAGLGLVALVADLALSPRVELVSLPTTPHLVELTSSRSRILKLSGLFALDSFGGGFVIQSLIAYWFFLKFGVGGELLGPLFFAVNLLKAVSYLVAVRLADRYGLLNTMVFTHLPSNVLLILIPLMPTLPLAMLMLLARHLLAQMDVPTRSSYIVGIVQPEERTAATGVTSLARTAGHALGPAIAGSAIAIVGGGVPFVMAGSVKILYDVLLYVSFRGVRPPEEQPVI